MNIFDPTQASGYPNLMMTHTTEAPRLQAAPKPNASLENLPKAELIKMLLSQLSKTDADTRV
jgi:hypothetical protein